MGEVNNTPLGWWYKSSDGAESRSNLYNNVRNVLDIEVNQPEIL